jgi:DNA polymerase-3 subunit alpha
MMAAFAGYGFPKAHAASYAKIAWRSAWCKTHFPGEFMASVLANWGGYYSQRVYLSEARRLGLAVRPPHVDHSGRNFTVTDTAHSQINNEQTLYMGLDQIKDLTARTIEHILANRPFNSLEDFLVRVDPRPREAESLVRVGALDGLGQIPAMLDRLQSRGWKAGQPSLFGWEAREEGEDWTLEQRVAAQQELLGISLDAHPLELVADRIAAAGAITTAEAAGRIGQRVTVAGTRQSSHRSKTAKGELMMFLTLEDLTGMLDVVVFPDVYRRARSILGSSGPILVSGAVEMDSSRSEPLLRAERVTEIH